MAHSHSKIWVHAVWATKGRCPFISGNFRDKMQKHLRICFIKQKCSVRVINCFEDHIHCLFLLNPNLSLKDLIMNVKGETSHWINENKFFKENFQWQVGYSAFSVSEPLLSKLEKYIINQEEHHK